MIFERVTLHNFGPYRGLHEIDLAVPMGRPIVAIGALNGSGKTTLLDAMQLALYGKNARCSGRERISYPDYLASMINREATPGQAAGVEFSFISRSDGHDTQITVSRTWSRQSSGIREKVEVYRGEEQDLVAADRWAEFVEDLMPSQIADLFFFDGEKIEALADPQRSSQLLRVGVHSLLGIDLVEGLIKSLQQLERKRKTSLSSDEDRAALRAIDLECQTLEAARADVVQRRASEENALLQCAKRVTEAERRFSAMGGDLFARRESLLTEQKSLASELSRVDSELRDLAGGALPLALAPSVLTIAASSAADSKNAQDWQRIEALLLERDQSLGRFVSIVFRDRKSVRRVLEFLEQDRAARRPQNKRATDIPQTFADQYDEAEVRRASENATRLIAQRNDLAKRLKAVEDKLKAVPDDASVAAAQAEIDAARAQEGRTQAVIQLLDEEIAVLEGKLERSRKKADGEAARLGNQIINDAMSRRIVIHAQRSRETLSRFRERLLAENVRGLERGIQRCFQRLLRKTHLVHGIRLDATTFQLHVQHENGRAIPAERLSAGERQLLAVATLWALAQASGRHLPAVIDTPLSRLDSAHRRTLVTNYFPAASHQVILLSTDEELVGRYYDIVKPYVGQEYLIKHDEARKTSCFERGYFPRQLAEAA